MKDTNRSLLLAVLACLSMGLFAKAPQFSGGMAWITDVFLIATFCLSTWGFWVGWNSARLQRTAWSYLAPGINAFIFITMLAFMILIRAKLDVFQ